MPAIPLHSKVQDAPALLSRSASSSFRHLARRIFTAPETSASQTLQPRAIEARQNAIAIPATYSGINSGPSPGEVVGIVLGSVVGFLLLIWLFSALSGNMGGSTVDEEEVVRRRSRSPRSKRSRRSEMTSRSPSRPQRVVRQERIIREVSRGPSRGPYVVEETTRNRVDGDDIVEVIEEESSVAPRRKSKRGYR